MITDTFFTIGKTHTICQDYAEHAPDHVIVCDGCSTAPESNVGAVLLSRAAKLFLRKFPFRDTEHFTQSTLTTAYAYARAMELHEDSLLATLLMAKRIDNNLKAVVAGDGIVAARYRGTSKWKVVEYTFISGAPFYLRYTLDPAVEQHYVNTFGTTVRQRVIEIDCTTQDVKESFSILFSKKEEGSMGPYTLDFPLAEYDAVAVITDGGSSFLKTETGKTSKQPVNVPLHTILLEVLNFKNYAGAFVQRRCKAAFKKFHEENNFNSDDFSIGVLYCPDEPAEPV